MYWENDAQEALKRAPVFVRRIVRQKVETHVADQGRSSVSIIDVQEARRQFMQRTDSEVTNALSFSGGKPPPEMLQRIISTAEGKGVVNNSFLIVRTCAAQFGCPMQVTDPKPLADRLLSRLEQSGLKEFIEARVGGHVLPHHKFKVALSGCPNACSQPQICDFGVVARGLPRRNSEPCTGCRQCGEACREMAIDFPDFEPHVDYLKCIGCEDCVRVCSAEALDVERKGYSVMAGGKLGRQPQLAVELIHLATSDEVVAALDVCLELYMERTVGEEGFAAVFNTLGADRVRTAIGERISG